MTAEQRREAQRLLGGSGYLDHPNLRTPGHHDPVQRLADYDHDGVAAGVLFHGSMNMEPIPFVPMTLGKATKYGDRDLTVVGFRIYNRWLADFVSVAPHRHIGLAYLPMWDMDAALEGTFVYSESRDVPSVTRASLGHTFCEIPSDKTRRMVGDNAIDVYGLDRVAPQRIARQIGAPSMDDLHQPIDAVPEGASATAFRSGAGGWS